MFKSKRVAAESALAMAAVLAAGSWLFLCLDLEIPMYALAMLSLALTAVPVYAEKGGVS